MISLSNLWIFLFIVSIHPQAYDLAAASNFSDVTGDEELAALLSDAHGGDIDNLDAITGALAEGTYPPSGDVLEALLVAAWSEQLLRYCTAVVMFDGILYPYAWHDMI